MGTGNIPVAVANTTIPAADHNSIRSALTIDHVPRNASANATDEGGNLGASAFRWLIGYIKTLFIGSVADNISIASDSSDCIINVGGVERARIPLAVELLPPGIQVSYAGTIAPQEWLLCDGAEVSRTTYARLYTAIADTYGEGNGSTTFNVPDYRGRFLRGSDDMGSGAAGVDPDAAGRTAMSTGGNTGENVGSVQIEAVGPHTHGVKARGNTVSDTGSDIAMGAAEATVFIFDSETATGNETRPINANVNIIIKT